MCYIVQSMDRLVWKATFQWDPGSLCFVAYPRRIDRLLNKSTTKVWKLLCYETYMLYQIIFSWVIQVLKYRAKNNFRFDNTTTNKIRNFLKV